jgi:hypothetical protein
VAETRARTIGDLLSASDDSADVYRQSELARLETCLADSGPVVAWIHGPDGRGKSSLLDAFCARAESGGADVDTSTLAGHVTAFFAAGTGGPAKYEGRDMTTTHASMGLSDADFDTAVADVLLALEQNGIGDAEKGEVAAILESLRPAVMGTGG